MLQSEKCNLGSNVLCNYNIITINVKALHIVLNSITFAGALAGRLSEGKLVIIKLKEFTLKAFKKLKQYETISNLVSLETVFIYSLLLSLERYNKASN